VWSSKIRHGWPQILRHLPSLLARFVFGRINLR
jgi:hypothetical protein